MESQFGELRQVALPSSNLSRSVQFYRDTPGIEFVAQFDPPGLAFFCLGRTRLLLEHSVTAKAGEAVLYFNVQDLEGTYSKLTAKGVQFDSPPHLIFRDAKGTFGTAGEEEWMAFFKDRDGNLLALASRVSSSSVPRAGVVGR